MAKNPFAFEDDAEREQKKKEEAFKARRKELEAANVVKPAGTTVVPPAAAKPAGTGLVPPPALKPAAPAPANPAGGVALQFDRAEIPKQAPGAPMMCHECKTAVVSQYYTIDSNPFCGNCATPVVQAWRGGTPAGRVAKATLFGGIGAVVGSLIYWAIAALTGYEIGLIAILVGAIVGAGVKYGCGGRGGLGYQFLAVFLTYTSIVSAYVPILISHLNSLGAQHASADDEEESPAKKPLKAPELKNAGAKAPAPADADDEEAEFADGESDVPPEPLTLFGFIAGLVAVIGFIYALPFIMAFVNPIGLLIIGFGLWQAWKANTPVSLKIEGPFNANAPRPAPGS
jgi:hypothetical protein